MFKWKLEASNRKVLDRLVQMEEKQLQQKRMLDLVTNECHEEFNQIKNKILEVTADVLV
jgi:hypothetical protein